MALKEIERPMDNFQKYSRLMLLIAGGFIAFVLAIALIFFLLRILSVTMFNIPGFDWIFQFTIVAIPYVIFYAAYYYLAKKIKHSHSKASRVIARSLLLIGLVLCTVTLVLAMMVFLKVNDMRLITFNENGHYGWIFQLFILLIAAGVIAGGDKKEKDWMERRS